MAALAELRDRPEEVLARAGEDALAYVRPMDKRGRAGYALFSADGELLGITDSRDGAFGLARQQGLAPVDVH